MFNAPFISKTAFLPIYIPFELMNQKLALGIFDSMTPSIMEASLPVTRLITVLILESPVNIAFSEDVRENLSKL